MPKNNTQLRQFPTCDTCHPRTPMNNIPVLQRALQSILHAIWLRSPPRLFSNSNGFWLRCRGLAPKLPFGQHNPAAVAVYKFFLAMTNIKSVVCNSQQQSFMAQSFMSVPDKWRQASSDDQDANQPPNH